MNEKLNITILARYCLEEQYKLAAETEGMLRNLSTRATVMHLSLRGPRKFRDQEHLVVSELPLMIDRASPSSILLKSLLMYCYTPIAAWRIRRFSPAVVYLSEAIPLYGYFIRLLTGIPVAITYGDRHVHNLLGDHWWSTPFLKLAEWIERFELTHVDGVFTRTKSSRDRIHETGVDMDRIQVVPDVPDTSAYRPEDQSALRASCGFAPDDVVIYYHGIMHRGKGLDMLIDWVAELHAENPKIGMILVGSGAEEAALREQAKRLGVADRIYFTGWLETLKEVGDYCNASDISIAMRKGDDSNDIVIPGALVHAMACRKVVIAPRMSGMSEVIEDGVNGFMFAADDGEDFKALIRRLIEDRANWGTYADKAYRDTQERYSITGAEQAYADAILHFAEKGKR